MKLASQVYTIDGIGPPKSGWKFIGQRRQHTSPKFFHSRYTKYNPGLIMDGNGLTLIDVGPPESFPQTKAYIEELGFKLQDLKFIIITHHHTDHIGELKHLVDYTGAKVYAHEAEVPWLLKQMPEEYYTREFEVANIDILLKGGEVLDILSGLEVIYTPGHTPGHISLYLPKEKILFAGDLVRYLHGELHLFPPQYTLDYATHVKSMLKVAQYDFDILVPGHGEPLIEGAGDKFREFIEYQKAISDLFLPSIKEAFAPEIEEY